jgi:ligand-binding SRPBCC domain-containing protein
LARIELSTRIAAPRERCFDLARSIDLHVRSTSATREHAVGGKTTGLLDLGDEITWRARHFGVWRSLSGRISAYDRPRHFEDTMLRGAFKYLRHDHFFDDAGGGTLMRDVFEYAAPLGLLGRLAERLFLTAYLRRFLEARNRELKAVAESDEWVQFIPPPLARH